MKWLGIILLALWLIGFDMNCTLEHDLQETYETTITRYVGPTDDATAGCRGTLPEPSPNNTNAVWLTTPAEGGSDANSGDQSSPKATLAGALAVTTGTRKTIHIFRPVGSLGTAPLQFNHTGFTLTASRNLQVEYGETAIVNRTGGGGLAIILSGTNLINGISFESDANSALINILGSGCVLDNCRIWSSFYNAIGSITVQAAAAASYTANFCPISTFTVIVPTASTGLQTVNLTNCSLITDNLNQSSAIYLSNIGSLIVYTGSWSTNANVEFNLNRCTQMIRGSTINTSSTESVIDPAPLIFAGILGVTGFTLNIDYNATNSYLEYGGKLLRIQQNTSVSTSTVDLDAVLTSCQTNGSLSYEVPSYSGPVTVSHGVTVTNPKAIAVPRFMDYAGLWSDYTLARLQWKGKPTPDGEGFYPFTSQLVGAGSGGVDINPWNETTVLDSRGYLQSTDFSFVDNIKKGWRFTKVSNRLNQRGNPRSSYKTVRRTVTLVFGSGDRYANNNELYRIINVLSDTGVMRFYEQGLGGNRFLDPGTNTGATSGVLSGTGGLGGYRTFTVTLGGSPAMIVNHWAGDWLTIFDGSTLLEYYIVSNTSTAFTVLDKKQIDFPANGTFTFAIYYMLCRPDLQDIEALTRIGVFNRGASSREVADGTTLAFELQGYELTLLEDEDETLIA